MPSEAWVSQEGAYWVERECATVFHLAWIVVSQAHATLSRLRSPCYGIFTAPEGRERLPSNAQPALHAFLIVVH